MVPGRTPTSRAAAEQSWLVGEDAGDSRTEELAELREVPLVYEVDERTDRGRVEDVGGRRFVLGGFVLWPSGPRGLVAVVQSADDRVDGPVDDRLAVSVAIGYLRDHGRVWRNGLARANSIETTTAMADVPGDDLTACGSGRVHALVVEDDLHSASSGLVETKTHAGEQRVGHPTQITRQSDSRMEDEAEHAAGLEVVDLADQLLGMQIVVPEPKRQQ